MQKKVHQGEFIKSVLDEHDKILARIAEKAGMSPQNLQSVFKRHRVDEDIVERIGRAAKLDMVGMWRAASDSVTGRARAVSPGPQQPLRPSNVNVAEPPSAYGQPPVVIVLSPGDPEYAEVIRRLIEKRG